MIITLAIVTSALTGPAAAPRTAPVQMPRAEMRYCVRNERTGSRLSRRECHTRAEWLQRGFDPLVKD